MQVRYRRAIGVGLIVATLMVFSDRARAQQVGSLRPLAPPISTAPTVLFSACNDERELSFTTFDELAIRARPMLWFSRDEPLLALSDSEALPSRWPRTLQPERAEAVVYYRITKLKSRSSDEDLAAALQNKLDDQAKPHANLITTRGANPEVLAHTRIDRQLLAELQEIQVRYMFYYPNELGAGNHPHDLESIELRLKVERADKTGNPDADPRPCWQIRVATVYGAAHGLGLFTNVLDLDDVRKDSLSDRRSVEGSRMDGQQLVAQQFDPTWPLVILVEEGKHASAPDRNGDGEFTPGYDVNEHAEDAWGARDTMRSRMLAPVFRADTFKQRIPAVFMQADGDGIIRPRVDGAGSKSERDLALYVRYDYSVVRATSDSDVCGDSGVPTSADVRKKAIEKYARRLGGEGHAKELLNGKTFCGDANVVSRFNGVDFFAALGAGGAYNGYTHFWERISGSLRFDGESNPGWTGTVPIPLPVPSVGGVVVVRLSGAWCCQNTRKSIDALYMPSASRFADWYVGAGTDYGEVKTTHLDEAGRRAAVEFGTKFRFPVVKWGMFLGSRVGIRANLNSGRSLTNARLVFELGAGIW